MLMNNKPFSDTLEHLKIDKSSKDKDMFMTILPIQIISTS